MPYLLIPLCNIRLPDPDAVHIFTALLIALKSAGICSLYLYILLTFQLYKLAKLVPEVGAAAKVGLCPSVTVLIHFLPNPFLFSYSLADCLSWIQFMMSHFDQPLASSASSSETFTRASAPANRLSSRPLSAVLS